MKQLKIIIKQKAILFLGFWLLALNGYAQDLQTFIDEAMANSPEIQKVDFQYKIASEKVQEVNSLPNTEFNFGVMAIAPEMEMPMERFRASAMQMLPWFGTISARENYASSMADAQYVEVTIAKRKLALSVAQFYYQLYEIRAKQEVLEKNIALLRTYERLALTSVEVGKASAVDVLRLQIRQNELQQSINVLTQQNKGIQAALNSVMNREHDREIAAISSLEIPENDNFYSYERLSVNPELLKYDKLYESVERSELLNQKESGPMVGFGVEYINQENSPMITSDFKDMVMPMVSLSIPIFNNKYKSQTRQNELRKLEIQSQKEERLNVLKAELAKAISLSKQARIMYETQAKNLKQAEDAEEILIKNYETGTIDFNDVLDIQELQLKFQMSQIEAVKQYYAQAAVINYLIE
ncbi:TolC family protein [Aequorivita vladivostokensis]|uniref:Transporter n=1 Tax=Aequorivita vladivostokensis TaxID=171194 RepID=A0ABR5DFC6_9FLAO|nr:TolC family protein [Aequorivita vladivostokensis]KJJ37466.1 transporter [Aequorivita vladivostokensis]MAB57062.1 TolC family protein [Aequorivita sp.]MBF31913.1 TolC family protein [Aequorivita sp.]|tara:strand:- start:14258 stop:15493 length:1236 start_codon:yes stop_codon:yes gene_type:complete